MRHDCEISIFVVVEETGEKPDGWAWAIYLDAGRSLIAQSRSIYWNRHAALEAGTTAAATVRRNLLLRASRVRGVHA